MEKKKSNAEIVLMMGTIGMISVLITIISDFFLIGRSVSAYSFLKLGTESMANIAPWRITVGTFIGVLALPFQTLGLIPLYYGFKPSGKVMPLVMLITTAHGLIMGVAFHMSYAYIGSGWNFHYKNGLSNSITFEMVKRYDFYWRILTVIIMIEILFSSVLYVLMIMKGKTLYSKWMALFNPACVMAFTFPFVFILPAPIGGFIAPAYLNISIMVFFGFSTTVIYRRLKSEE